MKKFSFFLLSLLFCATLAAQPYGRTVYPNSTALNAGFHTSINSLGFFMAGMQGPDIHIEKTNSGPLYSGSANFIRNNYSLFISPNSPCLPVSGAVNNVVGVGATETHASLNGGSHYAVAGAWPEACFLMTLNSLGSMTNIKAYPFPYSSPNISKPYIAEATNGDVFIAGKFDTSMYVMRVSMTSGNVVWSHFYSSGHDPAVGGGSIYGGDFEPADIIQSPFSSDVVLTGRVMGSAASNRGIDGFFLSLDGSTGTPNVFKWLGDAVVDQCNYFSALTPAFSNIPGGVGFILAGMSDPNLYQGQAWMVKVSPSGGLIWDGQYTSTTYPGTINLLDVVERQNTSGLYEIYGLCNAAGPTPAPGDIVFKIFRTGQPYSIAPGGGGMDEFYHNAQQQPNLLPVSLTYNQTTPGDQGLHIFSSDGTVVNLMETYFNGVSGCIDHPTHIAHYEGGHNAISHWINVYGSLSACSWLGVNQSGAIYTPQQSCIANSVTGGSNARTTDATGLEELSSESGLGISPNPSNGNFTVSADRNMELYLMNELGQHVKTISLNENNHTISISGLPDGIYFIKDASGADGIKQKIVVAK